MTIINGAAHQAAPPQDLPPPGTETSTTSAATTAATDTDTSNVIDIGLAAPPPDPFPATTDTTSTDSNVIDIAPATPNLPAPSAGKVVRLYELDLAKRIDKSTFPDPPLKAGGLPVTTIPNVRHLLTRYGITVRHNVIKKKLTITMPGHSGSPDNFDNVALTQVKSLATLNGMNTEPIPAILAAIGDRHLYNPVADWISSKPWDGVDRFPAFCETLVEREGYPRELKKLLLRRWLISAVAAVGDSDFSCRGVLTIQGPQSIGKTKWASALVPDKALAKQVVKLGHHMDGGSKDSKLTAITHWIVEIGELDGTFKKDIALLKGFLTLDQDKIRVPYGRADSEYARRTVFMATVNEEHFLVDPTGNTRFWTIPVIGINYEHGVDMQQVFAQMAVDYENSVPWWLTREEEALLEMHNANHRTVSALRERILDALDLSRIGDPKVPPMTASHLLMQILGIAQPNDTQSKECARVLREYLGEPTRSKGRTRWRIPLRVVEFDSDLDQEPEVEPEARPDSVPGVDPADTF